MHANGADTWVMLLAAYVQHKLHAIGMPASAPCIESFFTSAKKVTRKTATTSLSRRSALQWAAAGAAALALPVLAARPDKAIKRVVTFPPSGSSCGGAANF